LQLLGSDHLLTHASSFDPAKAGAVQSTVFSECVFCAMYSCAALQVVLPLSLLFDSANGLAFSSNVTIVSAGARSYRRLLTELHVSIHPDAFTLAAFSILRYIHGRSPDELMIPSQIAQHQLDRVRRPVSVDNELRVFSSLASMCRKQLQMYPTTLQEDLAELSAGRWPAGSNKHNALVLLRDEKITCQFYVDLHARAAALAALPVSVICIRTPDSRPPTPTSNLQQPGHWSSAAH
jgi:hypothetical protein